MGIEVVKFKPKGNTRWINSDQHRITEIRDLDTSAQSPKNNWTRKRAKSKNFRQTKQKVSGTSVTVVKTKSNGEKKGKLTPGHLSLVEIKQASASNKKQKKTVKRLRQSSNNNILTKAVTLKKIDPENLVELYHNNKAVQGSDSDESCQKNKSTALNPPNSQVIRSLQTITNAKSFANAIETMRPISIDETMEYYPNQRTGLSPIDEGEFGEALDSRFDRSYSRNYELPTIASKMKQVAKGYMRSFDFRTIPFCAARSTSPSHNIGINIQQVMSIIKTRQPITGISPTLAHNIGLAADKLQSNPLSALVSSLGSKLG